MVQPSNSPRPASNPHEEKPSYGTSYKKGRFSGGDESSGWNRARRVLRTVFGVFLVTFCLGALLALGLLAVVYRSLAYVPEFYLPRAQWSDAQIEEYHQKFLERVSVITTELKKRKSSQAVFREDELNGWIDAQGSRLAAADADLRIVKPRLQLADKAVWLAAEVQTRWAKGVLWAVLEPELRGPNVIAIRVREARLGKLPLPTNRLMQFITSGLMAEVLQGSRAGAYWEISHGRPVLVLHLDLVADRQSGHQLQVEDLRVGEGVLAIHLAEVKGS